MEAMLGWLPRHLGVSDGAADINLHIWAANLAAKSARIRDCVEAELPAHDFTELDSPNPYSVGDHVLLLCPERQEKCLSPFESGWQVYDVIHRENNGFLQRRLSM